MIQTTALKREERENPYKGIALPDNVKEQTKQVSEISDLLGEYEEFLNKEMDFNQIEKIIEKETILLTPDKIDDFLQQTILYENHKKYEENTGAFISQLIQTSYNAGNNNFELNTKKLKTISNIGAYLIGKKRNPIIIKIEGNTGYDCGSFSQNSIFNIEGNTRDHCGHETQNCNFNIKGNTEKEFGHFSENCLFKIEGDTEEGCGWHAKNCRFYITGNTGDFLGMFTKYSKFIIKGNTGKECGYMSKSSLFAINENAGKNLGCESDNCTFNTSGKIGESIGFESKYNAFSTPHDDIYHTMKGEIQKTNIIILTDRYDNILKKEKKTLGIWSRVLW